MMKHQCIKCKVEYEDDDVDDYYCPPCNEERKIIAKQIDEKLKGTVTQGKSAIEEYDEARKGARFPSAKSLGI